MAKSPKLSIPGSIFKPAKVDRLYIKFRGKTYSTGLKPDRQGYALAKALLEKKFLDFHNLKPEIQVVTFQEAWAAFRETLVNKAEKTVKNYNLAYNTFVADSNEYLTNDMVEKYIHSYLKKNKHSRVSINSYLNCFQIFLNYCSQRKWIDNINYKSKYSLHIGERNIKSYTHDECSRIIEYFDEHDKEMSYIIQFMLETGARDVDVLTLQWDQINFETRSIHWNNKISKITETRPASLKAMNILAILKTLNKNKVFSWLYSSASSLNKKLRKAFEILSIDKDNRSLQEFRVTFRMFAKEKSMPEDLIEYMLRHSSGKLMTKYYTDYNSLEQGIRKYIDN